MQLGLRAKLTMVMTALAFLTTAVLSVVFLHLLMQQVLGDALTRAKDLSKKCSLPQNRQ